MNYNGDCVPMAIYCNDEYHGRPRNPDWKPNRCYILRIDKWRLVGFTQRNPEVVRIETLKGKPAFITGGKSISSQFPDF